MNCQPLCEYVNHNWLHRPHFTCLTCWLRRYYYGKVDKSQFVYSRKHAFVGYPLKGRKRKIWVMTTDRTRGLPTPRHYFTYYITMRAGGELWLLRNAIIKTLLTIAEFVAQR